MADPAEILDFWIGDIGPEGWYAGGEEIDAEIRDRFQEVWQAASEGGLDHWLAGPGPAMALIVLTDQFPRNMFRGMAQAFATDPLARGAAHRAIDAGWDLAAPEPERQFFYMPFMHSEVIGDQDLCVALLKARMPEAAASNLLHAHAHREVIRRFGRFPFRNAALGRENTPEETDFLENGGYGALLEALKIEDMQ